MLHKYINKPLVSKNLNLKENQYSTTNILFLQTKTMSLKNHRPLTSKPRNLAKPKTSPKITKKRFCFLSQKIFPIPIKF